MIVVWTNAGKVQSSVRKISNYASPLVFKSDIVLRTIAAGTFLNATHLTYTFLCQKCHVHNSSSLGWAMSTDPVRTPEDADGSRFGFHRAGSGGFSFDAEEARDEEFTEWAATAA